MKKEEEDEHQGSPHECNLLIVNLLYLLTIMSNVNLFGLCWWLYFMAVKCQVLSLVEEEPGM